MQRARASQRAFTVIELMISVAIIFILVTTALVGLRAARRGADRTQTLNALRQMITGYTAYYSDHDGRLMPGYVDPAKIGTDPNQINIKAELKTGFRLSNEDAASYVWRLAPYVDYNWKVFMTDYQSQAIIERFQEEYGTGNGGGNEAYGPGTATGTQIGIAKHPSIGLNSLLVGGDSFHGGSQWSQHSHGTNTPGSNPNGQAVLQLGKAKSPSKLIVFAPSQSSDSEQLAASLQVSEILGYAEIRSPFKRVNVQQGGIGADRQWYIEGTAGPNQGKIVTESAFVAPGGFPVDRYGDNKIATAHLDGSVATEALESLGPTKPTNPDMANLSRWLPFVVTSN